MCVFGVGMKDPRRGLAAGGGFQCLELEGAGLVGGPLLIVGDESGIGGRAACREVVLRAACLRSHPSWRVGKAEVM